VLNRGDEVEHLALADDHVLRGERSVEDLVALLAVETGRGADTARSSHLLVTAQEMLAQFRLHREHIAQTIRDIDPGLL
jgi:hypothetical protein